MPQNIVRTDGSDHYCVLRCNRSAARSVVAGESEGVGVLDSIDDFPLAVPEGFALGRSSDLVEVETQHDVPNM